MLILDKLFAPIYLRLNNAGATANAYRENSHREHQELYADLAIKLDALAEGQKILSDMIVRHRENGAAEHVVISEQIYKLPKSPVKRKPKK